MSKANHPSHIAQLCRINRALGHLEGIKKMINEERYCVEILTQLKAVRSAIKSIELNVLQTHMQHCLQQSATINDTLQTTQKINELCELMKKF